MTSVRKRGFSAALAAILCVAQPGLAQTAPTPAVVPEAISLPDIAFTPSREAEANYDKYFYFHRDETDFATAFADLQECHGYASGISLRADGGSVTSGLTGVAVDAIVGSALRRDIRRRNLRTCMRFKDYRVYGLPKSLWERFNSQEDYGRLGEAERRRLLAMQARLASGPRPPTGEIAP